MIVKVFVLITFIVCLTFFYYKWRNFFAYSKEKKRMYYPVIGRDLGILSGLLFGVILFWKEELINWLALFIK